MWEWFAFANPERLWVLLLVPLLIAGYVLAIRQRNKVGMRFTNTTILGRVVPKQSQWRRHLAVALSLLSLVALSIAWSRPQGIEMMPRERATVVMVVDVSLSMQATDIKPNRFDAAKAAAIKFVESLPPQYNVAVVGLSGSPSVRMPPSLDRAAARQAISSMKLAESTAVGESIYASLEALQMAPKGQNGDDPAPGAIVLLSDGQNTAGRAPAQAAADAEAAKVPVYTIAYGTDNGYVDLDGKRETVPPDRELLAEIATATGGQAFSAEDLGQLDKVYSNIRSEVGQVPTKKETTALWAGYGLAFAVVAALAAVSLGARWP